MSRSLLAFLLFCLSLAAVAGALVWHLGPTLVGILVDPGRRAEPYHVLRIVPGADRLDEAERGRRARFLSLAAADGGTLVWQSGVLQVLEGPVRLDDSSLQVLTFASGGGLVQFFTGSEYRALAAEAAHGDRFYGTRDEPGALAGDRVSVMVLYRANGDGGAAPLGVPGGTGWLARAPRHGGELRWRTGIEPVAGRTLWNQLLMLQFPDARAARAWLDDPATVTERALAARHVDDVVILLVHPA